MATFTQEVVDYDVTFVEGGVEGEIVRQSKLTIQLPNNSEPFIAGTIVPSYSRKSSFGRGFSGIEGYEDWIIFEITAATPGGGNGDFELTGAGSEGSSADDVIFMLMEPVPELIPYINFDYPLTFDSENILTDDIIYTGVFNHPDARIISILDEVLELPEEPETIIGQPPDLPPDLPEVKDVPESDPIFGLGLIGFIGIGIIVKRTLSRVWSCIS